MHARRLTDECFAEAVDKLQQRTAVSSDLIQNRTWLPAYKLPQGDRFAEAGWSNDGRNGILRNV
jgi:hypothetical protein